MKIITNILKFIVMTIIVLCLTFMGIKNIAFSTILNKEYITKKLNEINFYSETYELVKLNFENYIDQSGFNKDILENICTPEKVENDINTVLANIYDGKQEQIDTTEISDKLNANIDKKNIKNAKNSTAIEAFVKHICQSYKDTIISTKYDTIINNRYENITQKLGKIEKIVITVLIINTILLIILNIKNILKILLNIQTITLATSLFQFLTTIVITSNVKIEGIKVFNEAFSNTLVSIIKEIFNKINKFGIILLIIYVIFVIIYSIAIKITKNNEQKENKEI